MMRILANSLTTLAFGCLALGAQMPAKPEFEVASIKPSPEPSGGGHMMRTGPAWLTGSAILHQTQDPGRGHERSRS
jgi:hypothetical protein